MLWKNAERHSVQAIWTKQDKMNKHTSGASQEAADLIGRNTFHFPPFPILFV